MGTNITTANNAVEYFGVAHGHIMTHNAEQSEILSPSNDGEITRQHETRLPDGKFAAGYCPNPLGRPKGSGLVSDAIKQALRDGKAEEVKETLFKLVNGADRDSVRLAAIAEVIDRSEGKATQNVRHAGVFMVMAPGAEALAALDNWAEDE